MSEFPIPSPPQSLRSTRKRTLSSNSDTSLPPNHSRAKHVKLEGMSMLDNGGGEREGKNRGRKNSDDSRGGEG